MTDSPVDRFLAEHHVEIVAATERQDFARVAEVFATARAKLPLVDAATVTLTILREWRKRETDPQVLAELRRGLDQFEGQYRAAGLDVPPDD